MSEEIKEEKKEIKKETKALNIYKKLGRCRVELQEKNLKKGGCNKYAGFSYYELADFLPNVNILFDKYGLLSKFDLMPDKSYATLKIIDSDTEKELIFTMPSEEAPLKGSTPIQQLGSVNTYLKRYLYLNALEIVENDLLDSQSGNVQSQVQYATNEQLGIIFANEAMKRWSINKLHTSSPTFEQAAKLIQEIEETKARRTAENGANIRAKNEGLVITQGNSESTEMGSNAAQKAKEIFNA